MPATPCDLPRRAGCPPPRDTSRDVAPIRSDTNSHVASVVARLTGATASADELRRAVESPAGLDRVRLGMTILGVTAFAHRHLCSPTEVRQAVAAFVRASLPGAHAPAARERCLAWAVGFVDALYLTFGQRGFGVDFRTASAAIPGLLDEGE